MVNRDDYIAPVWTLATREISVPALTDGGSMTSERLAELRTVLATMAETPVVTLEAHPINADFDRSSGIPLDGLSPLATNLSRLISETSGAAPAAVSATSGETLYRMVVPAKVAAELGSGMVKPMVSKAASGGVHSALMGATGIAGQATFVPAAGKAAAAGAAGGSAATAGLAIGGAGAFTVAAPLVMMAVAVSISAHADRKRQEAIENITKLLEKLHSDALDKERSSLNGCRDAIEKATAVLLDQGRVGASLGLDSAVHAISTALADAEQRLKKWTKELAALQEKGRVELAPLHKAFPGIDVDGGEFFAHLELADLAISLKKRVIVLQAVEHAQMDSANPYDSFIRTLRSDQQRVTALETGIADVRLGLSTLELDRSHGIRDFAFSANEVDKLLRTSTRLRAMGAGIDSTGRASDLTIDIARSLDGSIVVLPALTA